MLKKILISYDGSTPAKKAFDFGIEISEKFNAELFVLSVARPPEPPVDVETEAYLENALEHFQKDFTHMKAKTTHHKIKAHFEVIVGHPAQVIVNYADDNNIDLIITGSVKDKSTISRWLLGSVSKQVVHYAHCSVMVVREY